jgi:hypothetical protein
MMRSPSISLTFTDAVTTWSDAMKTKQMCVIELNEERSKVKTWTISRGNFDRNTRTIYSFVPLCDRICTGGAYAVVQKSAEREI